MEYGHTSVFNCAIDGCEETLRVVSFEVNEEISSLYNVSIIFACTSADLELKPLLNKSGFLSLFDENQPRFFHGKVCEISYLDTGRRFSRYQMNLRPEIWMLTQRRNMKIFQEMDSLDIIYNLLLNAGLQDKNHFRIEVGKRPPKRTYCTQYQETELNFIQRLMSEDGLHYHFEHEKDKHTLVISDSKYIFKPVRSPELPLINDRGMIKPEYVIHRFNLREKLTINKVTLRDYNFTKPSLDLEQQKQLTTESQRELYYHSGLYQTIPTGTQQANVKLLQAQSQITLGQGESNCIYLLPGGLFTLQEHSNPQLNQQYLVTKTRHYGKQPQSLEEGASDEPTTYNCQFNCTCYKDLEFKTIASPKIIKKNRCYGIESATVVGPKGEEIYTDQYGRIKVQFHWDRDGNYSEHASCWVRVVQPWTGAGWGALQLPRIGQEVLISFINSDPDRPIIKGGLYNGLNMPPYQLPEHKTKTTIKTCSTPNADGFNEWRYEDKKGQEQIFVHAERNIDIHVKKDKTTHIGHQQHEIVDQSHHSHIHQKYTQHVHGQLNTQVEQQQYVTVHGNLHEKSKQKTFTDSTQEIHLQSSSKLIIDANMELIAKGNNSFFKLNPGGVTMNGPSIRINAGGTPGVGTPAQSVALKSMSWDVDAQVVNVRKAAAVADIQCDLCKKTTSNNKSS